MSVPKRHHIIPKFFLERFSRDAFLSVYDRDCDEFRRQAPINTAVIKDYYTFAEPDGQKNVEIEQGLAILEGATKPVLEKLDRFETLTQNERATVALFVALLQTRVPDFERSVDELMGGLAKRLLREAFANPERARASLRSYERDTGKPLTASPEQMVEFVASDAYTVKTDRRYYLATMVRLASEVAPLLLTLNWNVLHAPDSKAFAVTDSPFIIIAPSGTRNDSYGAGIMTPGAVKFVPLGRRTALYMGDSGSQLTHVDIDKRAVRRLNLELTVRAERYVFAADEELVRSLVKATQLAERPRLSKVMFG